MSLTVSGTETGHLYDVFYADSQVPPVKWKLAEKGIAALGTDLTWTDCGSSNRLSPSAVSSRFYTAGIGDDTDGDGLGDAYEVLVLHTDPYQSHTGNGPLSDGDADLDGDGYSNLQEYNLGTDPTDPNSFPTAVRTYGEFALWSHINNAIYFVAGDVFTGHVHADDELYFSNAGGGPVFHGPVTSATNVYSGNISGIEFDQGLTLNSYQGSMSDVDFDSAGSNSLKNIALNRGLPLQGSTTITFNGGSMTISNDRQGWTNHIYALFAQNIIYVANASTGTASTRPGSVYFVGGQLSRRSTIVSDADMTIGGNIIYATDPRTNPTTTIALGLISRASVWVGLTAPNNLEIDAAIMATGLTVAEGSDGSFGVINYNTGSPRGTLTVLGGIVQEKRGAVGTFNGSGQAISGYTKNYSYDSRFLDNPPPYYPVILTPHQ